MINGPDENRSSPSKTGYKTPPNHARFRPGQSGNPRGRPKGRHREAPYDVVLGQLVTVREAGSERITTAAEAFLLQLAKRGLEGDGPSARAAMCAIEEARARQITKNPPPIRVVRHLVTPGSVNLALIPLRMAKLLDPFRDTARTMIEPWIVEAALARLNDRHLTAAQQRIIITSTRTPHKVRWPLWWTEKP